MAFTPKTMVTKTRQAMANRAVAYDLQMWAWYHRSLGINVALSSSMWR